MNTCYQSNTVPPLLTLLTHRGTHYIRDLNLSVSLSTDVWEAKAVIRDLTHALSRGAVCRQITIVFKNEQHGDDSGLRMMTALFTAEGGGEPCNFGSVFERMAALPWAAGRFGFAEMDLGSGVTVFRQDRKSVRTFSPFARIEPLKAFPAKWTLAHVIRVLLTGQYSELKCTGVYSDDYAGDAAVDFHRGPIANGVAFARQLIESPDGWWTYSREDGVSVNCHHFDSNRFVPSLGARRESAAAFPAAVA